MQITIISPAYPLRGGIASSAERLAYAFQEEGHDVNIVTFSLQYPNFLFPGKTQFSPDPAPKGLDISVDINSINPFNWWKVGQQIKQNRPDVVIIRYWMSFFGPSLGTIARLVRHNKHTKILVLADNIIPHERRIIDKPFTQYFVNSIDGVVVMSKSVGEDLKQFSTTKPVRYNPHPIYDNYGEHVSQRDALQFLNLSDEYQYLLFFGFIRAYKGLDLLLEAMGNTAIKDTKVKLLIAGEFYDAKEKYTALIEKYGLEDKVIIKDDFIPSEEVRYYFGASDLVVQPYKTATQSGISQLAYHFEKPMLVTNVGGLPEIVDHDRSGYVVPKEPNEIAKCIVDFFENDRKATFTNRVIERKSEFSWDKMVAAFETLIEEA